VSRLLSFSLTCSLLLLWQASPTGNVARNDAIEVANPVVPAQATPLSSEIPKPLWVSLVKTPPRHHLPTLPSEIGELWQNRCARVSARGLRATRSSEFQSEDLCNVWGFWMFHVAF